MSGSSCKKDTLFSVVTRVNRLLYSGLLPVSGDVLPYLPPTEAGRSWVYLLSLS